MFSNGIEWDEAKLGSEDNAWNRGLLSIIAFDKDRTPELIGTAFVIGAFGRSAIALTAAHNFQGIRDVQRPYARHHPSALPEFVGGMEEIDFDRKRLRAICFDRQGIEMAPIGWAAWDRRSDIGIFSVVTQNKESSFFETRYELTDTQPTLSEEICVLGYADMKILQVARENGGREGFTMERRLCLRRGRITAAYPDGHLLCRGPCVETTVPVFAGMSGGPAFRVASPGERILPFGVISSDPYADREAKNDRSVAGESIVALVDATLAKNLQGNSETILKLDSAYFQAQE